MELLFLLIICFVLIFLSLGIYSKLYNPILLLSGMIGLASVLAQIDGTASQRQLRTAYFWLAIGVLLFSVAFITAQRLFRRTRRTGYVTYDMENVRKMLNICCLCAALNLLVAAYNVWSSVGSLADVFLRGGYARSLYLSRDRVTSLPIQVIGWALTANVYVLTGLFPAAVRARQKRAKVKLVCTAACVFMGSILTMSKEAFIIYVLVLVSCFMDSSHSLRRELRFLRKNMKWIVLGFAGLLAIIAFQRNYLALHKNYNNYFDAIMGTVTGYLAVPVTSFSALIAIRRPVLLHGRQCFRPFFNVLSYLGLSSRVDLIQQALGGATGNVYSMFGNMFNDFGFPGIVALSLVFGLLLGALYRDRSGDRLDVITINAIVNMAMFFGYYDFKLIQTIYLFSMLYAAVFCKVFRKRLYVNGRTEREVQTLGGQLTDL